jgi:hypothetical protein
MKLTQIEITGNNHKATISINGDRLLATLSTTNTILHADIHNFDEKYAMANAIASKLAEPNAPQPDDTIYCYLTLLIKMYK